MPHKQHEHYMKWNWNLIGKVEAVHGILRSLWSPGNKGRMDGRDAHNSYKTYKTLIVQWQPPKKYRGNFWLKCWQPYRIFSGTLGTRKRRVGLWYSDGIEKAHILQKVRIVRILFKPIVFLDVCDRRITINITTTPKIGIVSIKYIEYWG